MLSLYSSIYSEYRGEIAQDGIKLSLGNRTRIESIASWSEPFWEGPMSAQKAEASACWHSQLYSLHSFTFGPISETHIYIWSRSVVSVGDCGSFVTFSREKWDRETSLQTHFDDRHAMAKFSKSRVYFCRYLNFLITQCRTVIIIVMWFEWPIASMPKPDHFSKTLTCNRQRQTDGHQWTQT